MEFKELAKHIDEKLYISLEKTFESFLENDNDLIKNNVHEQSISFKIACYLENFLIRNKEFKIDVEYNKYWKDPKVFKDIMSQFEEWQYIINNTDWEIIWNDWRIIKRSWKLVLALIEEWWNIIIWNDLWNNIIKTKSKWIRPDIIIHNRWNNDNYCVFEIKKEKLSDEDKIKLEWFTDKKLNYWYKYWIWISELTSTSINVSLYEKWEYVDDFIYNKN